MTRPHWAAVAAAALTVCGTLPTEMCACPPARTHLIVYGTVRTSEGVAVQGARVFVAAMRSGATIDPVLGAEHLPVYSDAAGRYRVGAYSGFSPTAPALVVAAAVRPGVDTVRTQRTGASLRDERAIADSLQVDLVFP